MNKNWTQVLSEQISLANDETTRYARAEKQICDELGPLLANIIGSAQSQHQVLISELRITVDHGDPMTNSDIVAKCVIVK